MEPATSCRIEAAALARTRPVTSNSISRVATVPPRGAASNDQRPDSRRKGPSTSRMSMRLGAVSRLRVVSQKRTGPRAMRRLATISPSPAGRISAARQRGTKSGYEATSATIANIVSRLHGTTAERSIRSIGGSIPGPHGRTAVHRRGWSAHREKPPGRRQPAA